LLTAWNIGTASYVVKRIGRIRSSGVAELEVTGVAELGATGVAGVQELQDAGIERKRSPFWSR
jgi:hypothetical protein